MLAGDAVIVIEKAGTVYGIQNEEGLSQEKTDGNFGIKRCGKGRETKLMCIVGRVIGRWKGVRIWLAEGGAVYGCRSSGYCMRGYRRG